MPDTTITQLLKKYSSNYVPGEKRSSEYDNMIRQQTTLSDNIHLLHTLNQELPIKLQLNKCDLKMVEKLLETFQGNLNYLHRQCKTETIILAFIFYIRKMENPRIQIEHYRILTERGLTTQNYSLIISRALKYHLEHRPMPITTTTNYDHDKLIRNGGI